MLLRDHRCETSNLKWRHDRSGCDFEFMVFHRYILADNYVKNQDSVLMTKTKAHFAHKQTVTEGIFRGNETFQCNIWFSQMVGVVSYSWLHTSMTGTTKNNFF